MNLPHRPGRSRLGALACAASLAGLACLVLAGPAWAIRIVEFNLGCASGDRSPMWIELTGSTDEFLDAAFGVQALDRNGALLWERRRVFGKWTGFLWFGNRTRFFIGTEATLSTYGLGPGDPFHIDAFMSAPMDTVAGTLVLFRLQGTVRVPLEQVRYGFPGEMPAPLSGSSMEFVSPEWVWNPDPIARNYEYLEASQGDSCLGLPRFFARQLMVACEDGGLQGQYVDLEATGAHGTLDPRVHLLTYDRDGRLLSDFANIFGGRAGEPCASGSHWLIGGPGYAAAPGVAPDAYLPVPLDPLGGRIELRGQFFGVNWVLDSLSYGNALRPRPPDGLAYEHGTFGLLVRAVAPTPINSLGYMVPVPGCGFGTRPPAPFIQEIALRCADGGTNAQFVEIAARDGAVALTRDWRLRAFDRSGAQSFDLPGLFDAALDDSLRAGNAFLVAAAGHAALAGLPADAALPATLDTLAGRLELVHETAAGDVIESVLAWGDAPLLRPAPGTSLAFNGRATHLVQSWPSPTDLAGRAHDGSTCHASHMSHGFVVNEVGTRCANGSTAGLFIEITSDSTRDEREPSLGLRMVGPGGTGLAQVFPLFPPAAGATWPAGSHWLVAAPGFAAQNGLTPDALLDGAPDASLAQIFLFRRNLATGTDSTLAAMTVSGSPPEPGRSVGRLPSGGYGVSGVVTPTRFDGGVVAPGLCYVRSRPEAVRIGELLLRCRDGGTDGQFVELEATSGDASYAADLSMRVFDHDDALVGTFAHAFGTLAGKAWRAGRPFTLAAHGFEARFGLAPDALLPVVLDTLGGAVQLVLAGSEGGLLLDELRWGTIGEPVPAAGASFTRTDSGFTAGVLPSPSTIAGDADRRNPCLGTCPQRAVHLPFGSDEILIVPRASLSTFESRVVYDATRGEVSLRSGFDEIRASLPDRFTVLGLAPGTPVALSARIEISAQARQVCDARARCSASIVRVRVNGGGLTDSLRTLRDTLVTLATPIAATAGVPFNVDLFVSGSGVLSLELVASLNARLLFSGVPEGAWVASCYGYDSRVSRGVGETQLQIAPGNVALSWRVLDPQTFLGTVERRELPDDWATLETRSADADGILRVIDRRANPGHTYDYRLGWDDVFGHETSEVVTVNVPRRPAFGLLGVRPNPSNGVFAATIEIAEAGEIRLEVLDVAGRLVASSRRLLAAGEHVIPLAPTHALAPGLYVVRFHAQGLLAQTTAIVLR